MCQIKFYKNYFLNRYKWYFIFKNRYSISQKFQNEVNFTLDNLIIKNNRGRVVELIKKIPISRFSLVKMPPFFLELITTPTPFCHDPLEIHTFPFFCIFPLEFKLLFASFTNLSSTGGYKFFSGKAHLTIQTNSVQDPPLRVLILC